MYMQKKHKQALQLSGAILAISTAFTVAVGSIPREKLLQWGETMALLSTGIQQPVGGAAALSERLEREPAEGDGNGRNPGSTGTSSSGEGITQPADQEPNIGVSVEPVEPPPNDGSGGLVSEQKMSIGSEFIEGVAYRNKSGKSIDIGAQLAEKPDITIRDTDEPQVLIVHTHTTEAYMEYYAGYYVAGDGGRTDDNSKNVCRVGDVLAAQLEAAGIKTIHNTTVHDSPYTGAYDRSAATVESILEEYPSIQVVIDLHRDGIMLDDTTRVKPTAVIEGRKAAQIMIITGVVSTDKLPHPNWQENLRLTLRLQQAVNEKYEGLIRPLSIGAARYNQHLSKGAMLIEMGSEANTLDEAVYSAQLLGKTLAEVLGTLKE